MSGSSAEQVGGADRPADVTDPLLWRLALAVADAHQPDDEGACDNPSCVGASWPCAAWNSAQEGLRAAQVAPRTGSSATDGDAAPDHHEPPTARSTSLMSAA
ncbi:hypothetical protein GA0070624_3859 [Micromonospora rhizosphaerae]|uniref:Uncharacterized protein n=1 Tax=Micromonospora rhizosphaerae TaxID=568872 RepID=A0A1C6SIQ3_9ACTN|nr:hypothetical protein [Micromonospora rhizosphaerae]SCL29313.1 hypothetical protein GA0070624_3859 [Micromonospora rhizosphaerae]